MKISVIVPVYNAEGCLAQCVDSILAQEFTDFELLLIDDGSTDGSGKLCDGYAAADARVRVIHASNGGPSRARNMGIEAATGDYVCFVDSDDFVSPRYLADFMVADEALSFVIQGFTLTFDADASLNHTRQPAATSRCTLAQLMEECERNYLIRGPVCKLFNTATLRDNHIRFPEDYRYGEDAIFVKQYLQHAGDAIYTVAASNYTYTHHGTGTSITSSFRDARELYDVTLWDWHLYGSLRAKAGGFTSDLDDAFTRMKAIDLYQSVRNVLVDKHYDMSAKKHFVRSIDKSLLSSVRRARQLPLTFRVIRWCMTCLPQWLYVPALSLLMKK